MLWLGFDRLGLISRVLRWTVALIIFRSHGIVTRALTSLTVEGEGEDDGDQGLSAIIIVAIVVGSIAGLALLIFAAVFVYRNQDNMPSKLPSDQNL